MQDQLTIARELALLGDYETSLVYYDGVIGQMNLCVVAIESLPPARGDFRLPCHAGAAAPSSLTLYPLARVPRA